MNKITYTLLADGRSDRALMNIIKWSIRRINERMAIDGEYADLGGMKFPPKNLGDRIDAANKHYPSDVLFIHRDAENESLETREEEIKKHLSESTVGNSPIFIIPVRMMEAWLLIDKAAIAKAAGNREFKGDLEIPKIKNIEKESNPKKLLQDLIYKASEKAGRARKKLNIHQAVHLVSNNINDFSSLLSVPSFARFYDSLEDFLSDFSTT